VRGRNMSTISRKAESDESRRWLCLGGLLLGLLMAGCASPRLESDQASRPFAFEQDTFAYANELVWDYSYDENGRWRGRARNPKPDYTHHCFVMARSAKQFFLHAQFDPDAAVVDDLTYRRLVRSVLRSSPRRGRLEETRVVIPGYSGLRDFSQEWGQVLREEGGGAWQSYWQRGHWRIVFPFSRRHQDRMARALVDSVEREGVAVVHLVQFPRLKINHAVVLFAAEPNDDGIEFGVYDPNAPEAPTRLSYDRVGRRFEFPFNAYYPGGPLDVYEIYRGICY
jgi:hypothetical protein